MAAFDLRKMGVSVSSSAGSSLPPPSLAATGGGARQAGVLAGGLRYSDPLDWSAAHVLQEATTFCDSVAGSAGSVGLILDEAKAITCRVDDFRVVAVHLRAGRPLHTPLPPPHRAEQRRWLTEASAGRASALLWSPRRPDAIVVGSSAGVIGALQLPLRL